MIESTDKESNLPEMPPLNLPPAPLKLKREQGSVKVFDELRGKYVVLTPEEYVRQHFINFLVSYLHYPRTVLANEIGIELNGTRKRCDSVVFDSEAKPLIIIEYKAPEIAITQTVFDQIVRYNMKLRARYLIVSNGIRHYCCVIDYAANTYHFIPRIPDYPSLRHPISDN